MLVSYCPFCMENTSDRKITPRISVCGKCGQSKEENEE